MPRKPTKKPSKPIKFFNNISVETGDILVHAANTPLTNVSNNSADANSAIELKKLKNQIHKYAAIKIDLERERMKCSTGRPEIQCRRCQDRGWYTEPIAENKVDVLFCDCPAEKKLQEMLGRWRAKDLEK